MEDMLMKENGKVMTKINVAVWDFPVSRFRDLPGVLHIQMSVQKQSNQEIEHKS